jgi:hypothetical protein
MKTTYFANQDTYYYVTGTCQFLGILHSGSAQSTSQGKFYYYESDPNIYLQNINNSGVENNKPLPDHDDFVFKDVYTTESGAIICVKEHIRDTGISFDNTEFFIWQ